MKSEAAGVRIEASRVHPDDYNLCSALADCYDMLHRREDLQRSLLWMRELLVRLLARQPDDVRTRSILGIALAQSGEHEAAIVQIERHRSKWRKTNVEGAVRHGGHDTKAASRAGSPAVQRASWGRLATPSRARASGRA